MILTMKEITKTKTVVVKGDIGTIVTTKTGIGVVDATIMVNLESVMIPDILPRGVIQGQKVGQHREIGLVQEVEESEMMM